MAQRAASWWTRALFSSMSGWAGELETLRFPIAVKGVGTALEGLRVPIGIIRIVPPDKGAWVGEQVVGALDVGGG